MNKRTLVLVYAIRVQPLEINMTIKIKINISYYVGN